MDALNKAEQTPEDQSLNQEEGSLAATEKAINSDFHNKIALEIEDINPSEPSKNQDEPAQFEWRDELDTLPNADAPSDALLNPVFPAIPQLTDADEILAIVSKESEIKLAQESALLPLALEAEPVKAKDTNLTSQAELSSAAIKNFPPHSKHIPVPKLPDIEDTLAALEQQHNRDNNENISPLLVHNPLQTQINHTPLYLTLLVLFSLASGLAYYVYTELEQLGISQFSTTTSI